MPSPAPNNEAPPPLQAPTEHPPLLSSNWNVGFTLGAGCGMSAMGSDRAHDLAAATLHIGKLLESDNPTFGPFIRQLELAGEFWTGAQYHPDTAYVVGLTPILRYHFFPGSRLSPFIDGGIGVNATDIGRPDLSTTLEFSPQAGAGFLWFWREDTALTFEARYIHLSNGGINTPNSGVNTFLFSSGLTWFF